MAKMTRLLFAAMTLVLGAEQSALSQPQRALERPPSASLPSADRSTGKPAEPSASDIAALIERTKRNLVFLKGGTFGMGDWGNEDGLPYDSNPESKPLHKVTLDSFSILKYKVTFAEFDVFTRATGRPLVSNDEMDRRSRKLTHPASVNWYGAKAYCGWLSKMSKLPFDLPTEAQWEYAARSRGQRLLYATDNGKLEMGRDYTVVRAAGAIQGADPAEIAKYVDEPGRNYPNSKQRRQLGGEEDSFGIPVGSFPPNPSGLYGMAEIVTEWADDWFGLYNERAQVNPKGPLKGLKKVTRGVFGSPELAFSFVRHEREPEGHYAKKHNIPRQIYEHVDFSGVEGYSFRCSLNTAKHLP
jgi:formylglycine-generating enzyme